FSANWFYRPDAPSVLLLSFRPRTGYRFWQLEGQRWLPDQSSVSEFDFHALHPPLHRLYKQDILYEGEAVLIFQPQDLFRQFRDELWKVPDGYSVTGIWTFEETFFAETHAVYFFITVTA